MTDRRELAPPFACARFALLRSPVLAATSGSDVRLDVEPGAPDEGRRLAEYLRSLVADPLVREAVHVSSRSLSHTLDKVLAGDEPDVGALRSAVFSLSRYRLRMATRATPQGLLAGVAVAAVDPADAAGPPGTARGRLGGAHRRAPRLDMGWLMGLVSQLEQRPGILPHLRVAANGLARVRGERLELPCRPGADYGTDSRQDASSVSVRHTAAVRAVMSLTRDPIGCHDLVRGVLSACPDTDEADAHAMVRALVGHGILFTELRGLVDTSDPTARLVALLDAVPELRDLPETIELRKIQAELTDFAMAPLGAGRTALDGLSARLNRLHTRDVTPDIAPRHGTGRDRLDHEGRLVQVDLALDAHVRLPALVATEVERAAAVLWSVAQPSPATAALRDYHREFLGRYGARRAVPLKDLLDPATGLGAPAGHRMPHGHRLPVTAVGTSPERDRVLAELAARALAERRVEIALDEETLGRLVAHRPALPDSLELGAHLLAESTAALESGDFRLVVSGGSPTAGATFGRFSHLLPEPDRARLTELVRTAAAARPDTVCVQLVCQPFGARGANLIGVPRWLEHAVAVGGYTDRRDGVLDLDDLFVAADEQGLLLNSRSLGTEITPSTYHVLNPEWMTSNAERFLREIGIADARSWYVWSWGAAESLPFLPGIRHGRTVLSAARWRIGHELRDGAIGFADWSERMARWRERWRVPELVRLTNGDRHIELDLSEPLHLRILRQDVQRQGEVILREALDRTGWLTGPDGAHHSELIFPLLRRARTGQARPAPLLPTSVLPRYARPERPATAPLRETRDAMHLPGGEWLYAKLYGDPGSHSVIISTHLPRLVSALPAAVDRWFFLRFLDPEPHLRIRFHGDQQTLAARLLAQLNCFADELRQSGLIGRMVVDGYDPELERYGGPEAIQAAELAFHADSAAVVNQLRLHQAGRLPIDLGVLAAANYLRLGRDFSLGLHGDPDTDWPSRLPPGPGDKSWHDEFRALRDSAVQLIDPYRDEPPGLSGLPGGELLLRIWARRGAAVTAYGRRLATLGDRAWAPPDTVLTSLLHLHHNRLIGTDPETETRSYGIAAGAVRTHRGRRDFLRRQAGQDACGGEAIR